MNVNGQCYSYKENNEEESSPEPETGQGKFVFPGGAIYGEETDRMRFLIRVDLDGGWIGGAEICSVSKIVSDEDQGRER